MKPISDLSEVKWGYCTHVLSQALYEGELHATPISESDEPPQPNDVMLARVGEIDHHKRIELHSTRPATLYEGDLVGVAFGYRYATRQFEGIVPNTVDECHMLSVGGVCGQVIGAAPQMGMPTRLVPVAYVTDSSGTRVNLRRFGRSPAIADAPTTIVVVGSSMDSGKTTATAAIVRGLALTGRRVCAGKITGTGSAKDLLTMKDAGAFRTLGFTDVGHASTARASADELVHLWRTIQSNLALHRPDYIVLEIADGIVQRETRMLLDYFSQQQNVDHFVYCCCDTLGVPLGVTRLRTLGLPLAAISGMVTITPLAANEAREHTDVPVVSVDELRTPEVANLFPTRRSRASAAIAAIV